MVLVYDSPVYYGDLLGRYMAGGIKVFPDAIPIGVLLGIHMVEERLARLEAHVELLRKDLDDVRDAVYETRDYIMELRGSRRNGSLNATAMEIVKWVIVFVLGGLLTLAGVRVDHLIRGGA